MSTNGNGFTGRIWQVMIGLSMAGVCALIGWAMHTEGRISGIAKIDEAQNDRLIGLESGRSTPMAASTRERFDAHAERLRALEDEMRRLRDRP